MIKPRMKKYCTFSTNISFPTMHFRAFLIFQRIISIVAKFSNVPTRRKTFLLRFLFIPAHNAVHNERGKRQERKDVVLVNLAIS